MKINTYQLLAATLLIGGSFSGIKAVLSQSAPNNPPTVPDTTISNTATATYSDGTTANTYNATSNTVTVKVEVPGINVKAESPSNLAPRPKDTLYVDFTITNVGNDPTQFHIPGTAKLSNPGDFEINGSLQIVKVNGSDITPVSIDAPANGARGGGDTGTLLSSIAGAGSIPPNGTVTVRVPILVKSTAPQGAQTTVALGDTSANNDPQNLNRQNIDRTGNVNDDLDVYTVDNPDTTTSIPNEMPGVVTRVNEAMATSSTITVSATRLQAFATILKAVSKYNNNSTPSVFTDDELTYSLALRVENPNPPPAGLIVSDLHPTAISVNGSSQNYILVSDAIPTGTQLSSATPSVPDSNWKVVYTTSPVSTLAHQADWQLSRPSGTITRVGFIRSADIPKGETVKGFSFVVNPTVSTGGRIANIAQVFGQSQPGAIVPGTPTQLVYDESGDQAPNNQLGGGNPDPKTNTTGSTPPDGRSIDDGVANPEKDGIDPGTGKDPTDPATTNQGVTDDADGGEDTIYTLSVGPLNGPKGRPDAIHNNDNNADFTNQSIVLPANIDPGRPLTDTETPTTAFTNTVRNTSNSATTISLLPIPPTGTDVLPTNTIVTIKVGSDSADYKYDGTKFVYQSGNNTGAKIPVKLTNVPAGDTADYTVEINLPDGSLQNVGYSVPILAFIDADNDGLNSSNELGNITIDRLYTGYVKLLKEARILASDRVTPILPSNGDYTLNDLSAEARPGRIIQYRITYNNVSTATDPSSGSVVLPAKNLVITEDGATALNNWFTFTKDPVSATIPGSAIVSSGSISGTSSSGDIKVYVNTIPILAPGESGTFIFSRQIK